MLAALLILIVGTASAEYPEMEWERTYDDARSDTYDVMEQMSDGNIVHGGMRFGIGSENYTVFCQIKVTDTNGTEIKNRSFGVSSPVSPSSMFLVENDGIVFTGTIRNRSVHRMFMVKLDSDGNEEWNSTLGHMNCSNYDGIQTSDGGYALIGVCYDTTYHWENDIILIRTDSNGTELWNRTFDLSWADFGQGIEQTSDRGFIIVGTSIDSDPNIGNELLHIRTDRNGTVLWNRTYGGNRTEWGQQVIIMPDGGFMAFGYTESFEARRRDIWLLRTDSMGVELWNTTFGGPKNDTFQMATIVPDSGYLIVGVSEVEIEPDGPIDTDAVVARVNDSGQLIWSKRYGGPDSDIASTALLLGNNEYLIGGRKGAKRNTTGSPWLFKINEIEGDPPNKNDDDEQDGLPGFELTALIMCTFVFIVLDKARNR